MSNIVKKELHQVVNPEDIQVLKDSMFKGFNDSEIKFSMAVANQLNLSPLLRQVHFVKRYDKKLQRDVVTPQTGIDGLRLIADRTGKYAGSDEPIFEYAKPGDKQPIKASVTVFKILEGVRCAFTASARWDEFYPGDVMGFMWKSKPHVMLGKCAEGQALRKAFPAEMSHVYADEEMEHEDAAQKKAGRIQQQIEAEAAAEVGTPTASIVLPKEEPKPKQADMQEASRVSVVTDVEEVEPFESFDQADKTGKASAYYEIKVGEKLKGKKLMEVNPEDLYKYCKSTKDWFVKEGKKIGPNWVELFENVADYLDKEI